MKYKVNKVLGFNAPPDGYTPEEELLETLITNNTIQSLYQKLPTARMKYIVAAHFELGYSQDLLAEILGVSQPTLHGEIELIKKVILGYKYKPKKFKDDVKPIDVLKIVVMLCEPMFNSKR